MAILKDLETVDGVTVRYHRIAGVYSTTGLSTQLQINHYVTAEARNAQKEYEYADVYVKNEYVTLPFDPTMNIVNAYQWLKEQDGYSGGDDVLEEGQTGTLSDVIPEWKVDTAYIVGDRCMHLGSMFAVIQAHTSQADWTPEKAVSLFVRVHEGKSEIPEWVQPTGAHDAYKLGDKVKHNGSVWVSTVNNNVWEPGVYGWDEG